MEPEYKIKANKKPSTCNLPVGQFICRNANPGIFTTRRKFVERHLFIENQDFLIAPNGGTGDCCFKAIAQAIAGSELGHTKIREEVVSFVVNHRWDKLKESIEVQHIHGNQFIQKTWTTDPILTYLNYMNTLGTLGSSTELNAAGELFHFNFVTIQEYSDPEKSTYRVENCCPFDDPSAPFHYFYFTGDFDNGHWEYLDPLNESSNNETIPDGMYPGSVKVLIEGLEINVEDWLKIHTYNTNDELTMKHTVTRYSSVKSPYPFESEGYSYTSNDAVLLKGLPYRISKLDGTDLFSVLLALLFPEVDQANATLADKLENQIIDYRVENIGLLNYKLITQPFSHGFDVETLKFIGMTCKGNVQDLLAAADLFGFSFEIFIKPDNNEPIRSCRFVHVDRWGGETDRVLHFVMRLIAGTGNGPLPTEDVMAKWWHVTPQPGITKVSSGSNNNFLHQDGDFVSVSGDQTGSVSRRSSKHTISACGSGDDHESTKNSVLSHNHDYDSTSYDKEADAQVSEEDTEDHTSTKTGVGKTESDSDHTIEESSRNVITNQEIQTEVSNGSNCDSDYASSCSRYSNISSDRSRTGRYKKSLDSLKNENSMTHIKEENNNVVVYFAQQDYDKKYAKKEHPGNASPTTTRVGLKVKGESTHKLKEVAKMNVNDENDEQSRKNQRIVQLRKSQSDKIFKKGSEKAKFIANMPTIPRVQTQVYIYDEVTDKRREYRFEGVKSREHVLKKLLKLGYIKRIPPRTSSERIAKSNNTSNTSFTERVEISLTQIGRGSQIPVPLKCESALMKAAEKYKINTLKKLDSNFSRAGSSKVFKFNKSSSIRTMLRSGTANKLSGEISSQDASMTNCNQEMQTDDKESKESLAELQLPRPKSASVLALVDQDSVEQRNEFLTTHKVSPRTQRNGERIESEQKSLLERFVSWIASFFDSCKNVKVDSTGRKNV